MKYFVMKLLFLLNQILLILHMCYFIKDSRPLAVHELVPLVISTVMLADISYIISSNIRENKVLSVFCGVLAIDSWYVMLSGETGMVSGVAFSILSPAVWLISVQFLLVFLFQGSGYRFRAVTDAFLFMGCMGAWIGLAVSDIAFASMYGIQFLVNLTCLVFLMVYHRKRVLFIIKSEKKYFLISLLISALSFAGYYLLTADVDGNLSNFGIYLPVLLFFMSIHGIALKEHAGLPVLAVMGGGPAAFIALTVVISGGAYAVCLGGGAAEVIISVNLFFMGVFLCNILLGERLKKDNRILLKKEGYQSVLKRLQSEEKLKTEFSDFLHDDVLQDLLSIKNMVGKAQRADVQKVISQTLEELNIGIRKRMQDYHPVILKNLTIKENFQNLLEEVSASYPQREIQVIFECSDDVFLVEPYDVLLYRFLKELLNNVYKHSDGRHIWVTLVQEQGIIRLTVSDDGTSGIGNIMKADVKEHKGLLSIREQAEDMEGTLTVSENAPMGVRVQIMVPMKGEDSYQYFVSR